MHAVPRYGPGVSPAVLLILAGPQVPYMVIARCGRQPLRSLQAGICLLATGKCSALTLLHAFARPSPSPRPSNRTHACPFIQAAWAT